jgi:hypothetical protein
VRNINAPRGHDASGKYMKEKRQKKGKVNAYSYTRIAGNYIRLFSAPAKLIILLIIIVLLLIFGVIFFQSVIF